MPVLPERASVITPTGTITSTTAPLSGQAAFPALGARRLLVIGGIALILAGMVLGDIFAVFVLHQNAGRINQLLLAATQSIASQDSQSIPTAFQNIGGLLENRGTKVDTHVHMIDFGYLALLLALVQPFVALSEQSKRRLACLLIVGAVVLPVGVFLIHYVGLAYSPFEAIGWASIVADFGGLLVIIAGVGELAGLWRFARRASKIAIVDELLRDRSSGARALLVGGALLVLAGFLHGVYYSGVHLYQNEAKDVALLSRMTAEAASKQTAAAASTVDEYAQLQGAKAVNVAAHSHIIEFGLLAMLLAFFQPYVFLSERWKKIWVTVLLAGSMILPVAVLLELSLGLVAGGIADFGGLLVMIALVGMLAGIVRYTGRLDAGAASIPAAATGR